MDLWIIILLSIFSFIVSGYFTYLLIQLITNIIKLIIAKTRESQAKTEKILLDNNIKIQKNDERRFEKYGIK